MIAYVPDTNTWWAEYNYNLAETSPHAEYGQNEASCPTGGNLVRMVDITASGIDCTGGIVVGEFDLNGGNYCNSSYDCEGCVAHIIVGA